MMPTLHFKDYKTLVERIDFIYKTEIKGNEEISIPSFDIIGLYKEIKPMIVELAKHGYNIVSCKDFAESMVNGYESEYLLSIYDEELWIEPMYQDDRLMTTESFMAYVFGDCNSKILKGIHASFICDIDVGNVPDDCDNKKCDCKCKDNQSVTSSQLKISNKNKSSDTKVKAKCVYKINGKEVDKSTYDAAKETMKRYDNVDDSFMDLLKNLLLFQCSYRDRYNELLKILW